MENKIVLLTPKEIAKEYDLPLSLVYELLHIRTDPCPLVKGGNGGRRGRGQNFLVEKSAFEAWIRNRNIKRQV